MNKMDTIQLHNIKKTHRVLAILLCCIMLFSLCDSALISFVHASENTQQTETRDEIKARLMRQIRYEDWDPYSADMSLDEFYALMELFDEGKLPLNSPGTVGSLGLAALGMDEPGIEGEMNPTYIPRTMFMFRGLPLDGSVEYQNGDAPIDYNTETGYVGDLTNYPPGLDNYGADYQVPPTNWNGVRIEAGKSQVVIVEEGENDENESIAGNVVQPLFKDYLTYGYYVRRVTVENTEFSVLGAIKLPGEDNYVYYYLTDKNQNTEVSTTKLEDGKKFIVEYSPIEHTLEYEVRDGSLDGAVITNDQKSVNVLGSDLNDTWENIVFGKSHPDKTDSSAYSFIAYAPYGYTVEFYLQKTTDEETGNDTGEKIWGVPAALLGMDSAGSFDLVNGGWALGMEPDYKNGTKNDATILPGNSGPSTLTMSGNIFNNGVHHDRKIIAVVHENPEPTFFVAPIYHGTDNVNTRGSSAVSFISASDSSDATVTVPYDYEDVYMWVMGRQSSYTDYVLQNTNTNNTTSGNIVPSNGNWNWDYASAPLAMTQNPTDGTYSYQWTWQSNSGSGGYTLDSLEVNGVAVMIPFYSKYEVGSADPATHNRWYTETILPDGARLLVEHLMIFNGGQQHVYRFTVTGARSNVTVSAMNLIQGTGSPEFVTYQLTGVTDENGLTAIEYYGKQGVWVSTPQGNINVNSNANGIDFRGDSSSYGASIRFKLADGYSNPYYLWEATRDGVINNQASAKRDDEGNVILTELNSVIPLDGFSGTMDSEHVYGPDNDGWYYIRVTTQLEYKIALLTIGAKQVRYVVRYIPGTIPESTRIPEGMPTFDHTGESDFEIPEAIADQYDTKNGAYYDVTIDNVIILPSDTPSDPASKYKFVDWVLVDQDNNIIKGPDGKGYHYSITHINLNDVIDYAIENENLGGVATDIYVLRLMPNWEPIEYPFTYTITLNWVDALGNVYEELFEDWGSSLTDWDLEANGPLAVKVFKDAAPFKAWLLRHPTYSFWDAVNNATEKTAVEAALDDYVSYIDGISTGDERYQSILGALTNMDYGGESGTPNGTDNFSRIGTYALNDASGTPNGNGEDDYTRNGSYSFGVNENNGVVVIWMYEDKGYIAITETGGSSNESFLYQIIDKNNETLTVSVKGSGKTIVLAPLGSYTVKAINDWSWRYEDGICSQSTAEPKDGEVTLTVTGEHNKVDTAIHADYTNKRNDKVWLGGENSKDNRFADPSTTGKEPETNSYKTEYALPAVAYDGGKKKLDEGDDQ